MPSIFSKIISGQIPCYKIAETETCLAFLDVFPLRKGHVLVVPKQVSDYLFDLNNQEYNDLMIFSKQVAEVLKKTIPCKRISMHVVGLEVPHTHVHLIPIQTANDCDFSNPKLKLNPEEFSEIASIIKQGFV